MIDTEYWTEHHYSGHIFLIKSDEPASKWDGYCQFILEYRTIFGTSWTPDTVDAVQPPTDAVRFANIALSGKKESERASKPRSEVGKVIPPVRQEKPLEGHTGALESIVCSVCSVEVPRSGKRGRPRTIHKECR